YLYLYVLDIHSFPTRRSSDLLIRGVAGSGKTLILASRAKLLAKQHPDWKILILCYNISLASYIQLMIHHMIQEPDDLFDYDFSEDRKSTRLNSSHVSISYAVF